ncbi:PP2C family protein-serine/threonine phosphatase [Streptomyces antibioticus]|uniref:PP2C family protein-serine/threonine phosphatase n=1 Tax=Streptomyces antibioticus TaxID=1890 RepID=UPI0007C52E37|nr:PP2C family protein-serine/threonine phosphatase [Streptomyces antibioticus]MCX5170326.1 serine/threonine-protein phosphatase [Streptomyces antibioticus]
MEAGGHDPHDRSPRARARSRDVLQRHQLLRFRGRSVTWLVPLATLVAIAFTDWNTTGEFRVVSWCVFVSAIAAALCGMWTTILFAVLALITYVVADAAWPDQYRAGPADFTLVVIGSVLSVLAAAFRVRGERRMLHMMDIAETTRRTVLRPLPPVWGGLDHAAVYLAADAEARVGGDFYDIQPGPHGTRVLLGDVQGKGLGAVEAAAALLGTFREAAYHEADLATVADRLETRMRRHRVHTTALGRADGDRFATAVLLGFPPHDRSTVHIVGFGHEPALAVGTHGVRHLPSGDGLPLGLGDLVGRTARPAVLRVRIDPGETVLLVTDGVTEARDASGTFYPLSDRLTEAVARDPRTAEPGRLVAHVRDGTLRHCRGRLADDTTIFAVRTTGGPPGPESGLRSGPG